MNLRPAVTVATTATLAAGVVGVVRQRIESDRVRGGRLTPGTAAATIPPGRPTRGVADRLAAWDPAPPRTRAAKLVTMIWASPLTVAGLALAAAGGRRPRWDARFRCLVVTGVRGPSAAALQAVGAHANTVGHVVLARQEDPSLRLLAHEAVHVRQAERLGPLLLPAYVWLAARYGYRDHPLERSARAGARRWLERNGHA